MKPSAIEWLKRLVDDYRKYGFCVSASVSVSIINLSLQLFTVLNSQIDHCCFQALVTEPVLNRSHRDVVIHPPRRARFPKSVQYEVLANRMGFTTDLYLTFLITALGQRRSAVAAIKLGTFGSSLQFTQEMVLWIPLLIHEHPASVW